MPKSSTRETLLRQWEILQLLTHGGEYKTHRQLMEELNELGYGVQKRTIERDLEQLSDIFPQIECNRKGVPWGWRWAYATSINIPGINLSDALSMELIKNTLRPLLPNAILKPMFPRFEQAAARLNQERTTNKLSSWSEKVYQIDPGMPLIPPDIKPDVLDAVHNALMLDRQLDVMYRSIDSDEDKPVRMHPLGLVQRGAVTYLVATAFDYDDVLIWALQRISSAQMLDITRTVPAGFELKKYIESGALHFGSTKPVKLTAKIYSPELVKILQETPLSEDQKIKVADDAYCLTATVRSTWQLEWWILSQGADIEVVSPKRLRQGIQESLKNALTHYIE